MHLEGPEGPGKAGGGEAGGGEAGEDGVGGQGAEQVGGGEVVGEVASGEVASGGLVKDLVDRAEDEWFAMGAPSEAEFMPEYRAIEDEFIKSAKLEDLREPYKQQYNGVRLIGPRVCTKCRWMSGCMACDEDKAWAWACRATLYEAMQVGIRPKAKPKGRPKTKGKA